MNDQEWILEIRNALSEALRLIACELDPVKLHRSITYATTRRLREIANRIDPDFEVKE